MRTKGKKKTIFRRLVLGINLAALLLLGIGLYIGAGYGYSRITWREILEGTDYVETEAFQSLACDAVYDAVGVTARASRMESSRSCFSSTVSGQPLMGSPAFCTLGNAMTSRMESFFSISITRRSKP